LNEQDYSTIGGTLLGLAIGWAMKHFGLGGGGVPVVPVPAPIPAPPASGLEQRLLMLEAKIEALLALFGRPALPSAPQN
jgi:hypothetical protein